MKPHPTPAPLTVAMVPAGHPYPRHVATRPGRAGPVTVPADPHPDRPAGTAEDRWWPHALLDPDRLAATAFDVLHVHFGFEHLTVAELEGVVAAVRDTGRALVYTLHDLVNPHLADQSHHRAQLDVLVPAADRVVTLTAGAAAVAWRRWGVAAVTLPHPHVVPQATAARLRAARLRRGGPAVIGVAAKDLRASSDPAAVLPPIVALVRERFDLALHVTLHPSVLARTDPRAAALRRVLDGARDRIRVTVHERLADDALWAQLAGTDVCVLPYTTATHSGWLEACHDVGTSVVAPDIGFLREQGADAVYDRAGGVDGASLQRAVLAAVARRRRDLPGLSAAARTAQRERVVAAHERLYRSLVGAR